MNPFLTGAKYDEIYSFLSRAFCRRGADLAVKKTDEFLNIVGNKPVIDKNEFEFVVFWDKDTYLASAFERAGVKVFNSSEAIRICDNKAETYIALSRAGVNIPETVIAPKTFLNVGYNSFGFLAKAGERLGYPMIIKEFYGSFGKQVYLAKDFSEASKIASSLGGREIVLQKYVSESAGRDVRVNVVGGKVVASIKRVNDRDFRSNLSNGGKAYATNITKEQESAAISALKAVKADWGGVDMLLTDGEPIVIEVNSNMHFLSTFVTTGVDVSESIAEHVLRSV